MLVSEVIIFFTHITKYRFYYYLSMKRPTDQETTAIGKRLCYSQMATEGAWSLRGQSGGRKREVGTWARPFTVVCRDKAGR